MPRKKYTPEETVAKLRWIDFLVSQTAALQYDSPGQP